MKRYVGFILILLLMFSIFSCSKDPEDEHDELGDADMLSTAVVLMTGNIGEYDDYVGEATKSRGAPPPPLWGGPQEFVTPDGDTADWYFLKVPFADSIGADTLLFLLMQIPDRWGDSTVPFVTDLEVWILRQVHTNFYFNFLVVMDSLDMEHISGMWKWYFEGTWVEFEYTDISVVVEDWSGTIDVATSANINLTGYFDFNVDGSGSGWGKFQGFEFVRFTFYKMPPVSPDFYRGYFTLASEHWEHQHEFPKQ